ncbi:RING finger protein nhl-1-like isoform X2 [Oopsacas minuta]|uniref:RING finger protein nhl-1-like isoform X2 n=1 Tax=Oopsacas minuta TaxID=111878 RepID=A0AAV7KIJ4_9METZ|nr:RING finger protein nhl-1-like isoform X2 [Oopsacas minuta]
MASVSTAQFDGSFPSQVERVHREINERFIRAHKVLQDREKDLLAELQHLLDDFTGEGIEEEKEQMVASKELLSTLKGNTGKDVLDQSVALMDERIKELESKLETVRLTYTNVGLEWDELLEKKLGETGRLRLNPRKSKTPDYKNMSQPVEVFGRHSKKDKSSGVFYSPGSIAIDPLTNYIYICDAGSHKVQVFNSSYDFVFLFGHKMDCPAGICIVQDNLYVTQHISCCMNVYSMRGQLLHSVGSEGKNELEFDYPVGIDISIDKNSIYIAEFNNDRVQCLNLDLSFKSFIPDIYGAIDVKLTSTEVVVLRISDPCLIIYNYAHESIRHMITKGVGKLVIKPARLFVDESGNILIPDYNAHCLCVFSHEGELLHKIGKEGQERGEFIKPTGVCINQEGRLLVSSRNPNHAIQIF